MVEDRTTFTPPTKREIAQNILNKLMTEQDYFFCFKSRFSNSLSKY